MENRYVYSLSIVVAAIDLISRNVLFILAYQVSCSLNYRFSYTYFIHILIINNLLWALNTKSLNLYKKLKTSSLNSLWELSWKCIVIHFLFLATTVLFTADYNQLIPFIVTSCLLLHFYIITSYYIYRSALPLIKQKLKIKKPIALVGINPGSIELANYFHAYEKHFNFDDFLEEHDCVMVEEQISCLSTLREQIRLAAKNGIYEIYMSLTPERMADIGSLINEANKNCVHLKFVSDFNHVLPLPFQANHLVHLKVGKLKPEPLNEIQNRFIKRLFDITFSLIVIVFILSWLYPIMALLIKLESRGPVIFKQLRSGRNNATFWCYKFRSMRVNAESSHLQATRNDLRITFIGRIIRKTSLDELPQFFNVLLGDMSITGPRPHMIKHTEEYRYVIDNYMLRHYSKPGITGWAQINGFRGETKDIALMQKRVEYDIWYLENWSFELDLKILLLTVIHIFKNTKDIY